MSDRRNKKEKEIANEFDSHLRDIRQQLSDQLKCLDIKLETEVAIVAELQEFFKRRADMEQEYARNLDKLVKAMVSRSKTEKQEQWATMSTFKCWNLLMAITKKDGQDHQTMADIYGNQMVARLAEVTDNSQRIFRKCRDIGAESHEDMMKVLNELQSAMKTYHLYQNESKQAEMKLRNVEGQKNKVEQQLSGKNSTSRKLKGLERQAEKKRQKYTDNKAKALKARNDYLLCIDAANSAIGKYFSDDISDLMDCMDFGYHNSVGHTMMMYLNIHEHQKQVHARFVDMLNKCISDLDSRPDKQKFMELNNVYFMLPKKFEFQPFKGDEVCQISAQKEAREDLIQRFTSIEDRLNSLKVENDEIWKTLETTEKTLVDIIQSQDYDITKYFSEDSVPPKSPHEQSKARAHRLETESYYLEKFREYTLSCNRLARLQSKFLAIQKALGEHPATSGQLANTSGSSLGEDSSPFGPPMPPPKPNKKRRIGAQPLVGQPKLFGGSLEEYLEATGQEIPLIIKSCIRVINLYGLHHQGVFRVSGAQVEINQFKTQFESGEDALADVVDASDINSVAGVLKLYFRELREPLFPLHLFDALVECTREKELAKCVERIKDLLSGVNRAIFIVMRYLFAFLNHVTEYSDENMMDPYNLAICFGPTLLPIPPDRDQVTFQASVNEIIKIIISHQEEIFPNDGGEVYEKMILDRRDSVMVEDEDEETCSIPSDEDESYYEPDILEATAVFDFEGRSARELSFRHGDTLVLYHQMSADWWEGCFQGKEGLIPAKYISVKQGDDSKSQHSHEDGDTSKGSNTSNLMTTSMTLPHRSTSNPAGSPASRHQSSEDSGLDSTDKSLSQPNVSVVASGSNGPNTGSSAATNPNRMSSQDCVDGSKPVPPIRETDILTTDVEEAGLEDKRQVPSQAQYATTHLTSSHDRSGQEEPLRKLSSGAAPSTLTHIGTPTVISTGTDPAMMNKKGQFEPDAGYSGMSTFATSHQSSSTLEGARGGKTIAVVKPSPSSSPSATSMMMKSAIMTSSLIGAGPRKEVQAPFSALPPSAAGAAPVPSSQQPVSPDGDRAKEKDAPHSFLRSMSTGSAEGGRHGGGGNPTVVSNVSVPFSSTGSSAISMSSNGGSSSKVIVPPPTTSNDDFGVDIDTALEEVMAGLKSLEMQQRLDKRMSLPAVKVKQMPKHTPDLVIDLPDSGKGRAHGGGCGDDDHRPDNSVDDSGRSKVRDDGGDNTSHHHHKQMQPPFQQPARGRETSSPSSDPGSPTSISAAETFAQSNQGTLKRADNLRNTAGSFHGKTATSHQDAPSRLSTSSEPGDITRGGSGRDFDSVRSQIQQQSGPMPSLSMSSLRRPQNTVVIGKDGHPDISSSVYPHNPHAANPLPSAIHSSQTPSVIGSAQPTPPPVAQKPKPPMKVKPPVMKKPTSAAHGVQPPT